jgi:ribokinase
MNITVIGSLVMDLSLRVPQLVQPGGVVHGHDLQVACGGRGANQACAASRLSGQLPLSSQGREPGGGVALIGVVGQDLFGDAMLASLQAEGVDTHAVSRRADGASGCFIVATDPQGQTELLVANGANGSLTADEVQRHAELIRSSRAVLAQLEVAYEAVEVGLSIARHAGVLTILNAAPTYRYQPQLLPLCDVLTLNAREASEITGIEALDTASAANAAARLRGLGAGAVIVTLGADGLWVDAPGCQTHLPSFQVPVVDTLGAGDTFAGALAAILCEGADMLTAARFAVAAAALSVTRQGAQPSIPWRAEVERFLQ